MLVIYRTNKGFEGDVVTVMDGDADLAAALTGDDAAVLSVDLAVAETAALVMNPEKYVVRDAGSGPSLCERKGEGDALAAVRAETQLGAAKLTASTQDVAAAEPIDAKPVDVKPVGEIAGKS